MLAPVRLNTEWLAAGGVATADAERTAAALLAEGRPVAGLRRCGPVTLFAKVYRPERRLERARLRLFGGLAAVGYDVSLRLQRMGVACPAPVAVFRQRRPPGAVLLTEALAGGDILRNWFCALLGVEPARRALGPVQRASLTVDGLTTGLARFVERLHAVGIYHSDLHDENIWVAAKSGDVTFALLDVEAVRFCRRVDARRRAKNLVRLARNLGTDAGRAGIDGEALALRLTEDYHRLAGQAVPAELREAVRASVRRGTERWREIEHRGCGHFT